MEYVILGLLLLKPMTAYEISGFIRKNLALICSGSAGSIQITLKKLLKSEFVTVDEFVEGSINKKMYSITQIGKNDFQNWIASPMQAGKAKNMELSKLFFLGFAEKNQQKIAIEDYTKQLQKVKNTLLAMKKLYYEANFQKLNDLNLANIQQISMYQGFTLDFGIDSAEFEINWYKNLLLKLEK